MKKIKTLMLSFTLLVALLFPMQINASNNNNITQGDDNNAGGVVWNSIEIKSFL